MAAELGISVQWLRKLMARERAREDRVEIEDDGPAFDLADLPWVELVYGQRPESPHYDMQCDRLEKPAGAFRIEDGRGRIRVRNAGEDLSKTKKPEHKPRKFKPRSRVRQGKRLTAEEVAEIKAKYQERE